MAIKFNRSQTFATNGTVTAAGLHNLIDGTDIYQALITDQTNLTSVGSGDELLIADTDLTAGDAPRAVTVNELFEDALTISTYTNGNFTNVSFGTATGNHTVSTTATITTGTIPRLTAGTTTGTAAVFTSSTLTTAIIPSGTFGTTTSTAATITNLTTTLTGDFTISNGTATLGTTGVTEGTYGTSTIIPRFSVDTKGRIKTVSTTAVDSVKAGTIIAWSTGTAPSGYLHCDGSGISRTTYSDLFSVIGTSYGTGNGSSTFNIPDLRGIFIRGIDSQSIGGITYSGTIGTKSGDTMQGHFHSLANGTLVWRSVSGAYSFSGGVSHAAQTLSVGAATTDGTNGTPRIGSETAPANIALMYCIKF